MPDQSPPAVPDDPSVPTAPEPNDPPASGPQPERPADSAPPDLLEAMLSGKLESIADASPGREQLHESDAAKRFEERVAAAAAEVQIGSDDAPGPGDTSCEPPGDPPSQQPAAPPAVQETHGADQPEPRPKPEASSAASRKPDKPKPKPKAKSKSKPAQQQPRREVPLDVPDLIDGPMAVVRFGGMFSVGQFRHSLETLPACGQKVVVRTQRGIEMGEVTGCVKAATETQGDEKPTPEKPDASKRPDDARSEHPPEHPWGHRGWMDRDDLARYTAMPGQEYPLREEGRILRLANAQDLIDFERLAAAARQEAAFCQQTAREMKLAMKIVGVDHLLGGDRILFYFTSETRIDFRKLVQKLSSQYHTRIEMRQLGARDEARLVADYEKCGQQCCCKRFLKDLKPVSMRMAKMQKASLDPTKISGRCGRLMCCMRYEDKTYEELRKTLPKKKSFVQTAEGVCKVLDSHIITQLVQLGMPDGTIKAVGVEEILERNVSPPAPKPVAAPRPVRKDRGPRTPLREQVVPAPAPASDAPAAPDTKTTPRKPVASGSAGGAAGEQNPPAKNKKRRRRGRRNRRGKKDASGGGGG